MLQNYLAKVCQERGRTLRLPPAAHRREMHLPTQSPSFLWFPFPVPICEELCPFGAH